MITNIRKIGNSAGAILPAALLKKLDLSEGDSIEITEIENKLIIEPCKIKNKYTLKELLSQCDQNSPLPDSVNEWDNIEPVGREAV